MRNSSASMSLCVWAGGGTKCVYVLVKKKTRELHLSQSHSYIPTKSMHHDINLV